MSRFDKPTKFNPEEVAQMEVLGGDLMTEEQRHVSEERELVKVQERGEFVSMQIMEEKSWERRSPTPEEIERTDNGLKALEILFAGTDIRWHLDGAINISAYRGKYLGVHKDFDVSFDQRDLEKLDALLMKNGYGMFLTELKDSNNPASGRLLVRVGTKQFAEHLYDTTISKTDETGKLVTGSHLDNIDTHIIFRDNDDQPLFQVGRRQIVLPKEWYSPQEREFRGIKIPFSHPALVVFYKLFGQREYDKTDLVALAETKVLTLHDIETLESVLNQIDNVKIRDSEDVIRDIVDKLHVGMDSQDVLHVFLENSRIATMAQTYQLVLQKVSDELVRGGDLGFEKVRDVLFTTFQPLKSQEVAHQRLSELRGICVAQEQISQGK